MWSRASFSDKFLGFNGVNYTRIWLDGFVFNHAAAVLQMQGMALQDFFPPDSYFLLNGDTEIPGARGPFVFLRGTLSGPWEPPLRIKNVFLAAVHAVPDGMTKEELLAFLLEDMRGWPESL